MGTFRATVLPSNTTPESLPDKFSKFFLLVWLNRLEAALTLTGHPPDTVEFSGTPFAEFQLITNDCVKEVLQEMSKKKKKKKKSCDLDPIPTPILHDCLEEITPIVADIVNKSLSCGVVPQCIKHALVKHLLRKANLDPNCLSNYRPVSNLPFFVKGAGVHCVKTVFAALRIWQPSTALPVSLPKMPQHRNRLAACGKWPPSGLWQWSCVYFVTAWSVCSFWHHRPRHPNQKVTYHLWLFWNGSVLVHLLSKFSYSVCFCWSRISSICFEMWCAARFSSGTSLCTHSLSAMSFANQATHTISLQMISSSTTRVLPQTSQLLSIVWKTVLKMSLSGCVIVY